MVGGLLVLGDHESISAIKTKLYGRTYARSGLCSNVPLFGCDKRRTEGASQKIVAVEV